MNKKEKIFKVLNIVVAVGIIIASCIGIFFSNGGEKFTTVNMYGDTVELYGDGIYAFNSVLAVANRLGADVVGTIAAVVLVVITLWKKRTIYTEIIQTSVMIYLAYYSVFLLLGISMNSLYLLYVMCFGMSLFLAFAYVQDLLKCIKISKSFKKKRLTGTGVFLILVGGITALLWGSMIVSAITKNSYSALLGVQSTEVTYGIDLAITCPIFIICGIWVLNKKDIGYKVAPLLLNVMVGIAVLVISQRVYCTKLGIYIPIGAMIGFIISFIIMGVISLYLVIKLLKKFQKEGGIELQTRI